MRQIIRTLVACAFVFAIAGLNGMAAAAPAGSLNGVVADPQGAPVPSAAVSIAGASSASMMTTAQGRYSFASVAPGIYTINVVKSGYTPASVTDVIVVATGVTTQNVTLVPLTLNSVNVLGHIVTRANRVSFNTTPASVDVVSSQVYAEQAQPQVMKVLDQVPGIVIAHPGTTANVSSPGGITFANIRGGLGFETASLIDGHPLSVGTFGDYVTTFLSSYMFGGTEVIKGPGAAAPEVNYAIGGTVNFRTREPSEKRTYALDVGADNKDGTIGNLLASGTTSGGKLGYVFDYSVYGTPGNLHDAQFPFSNFSNMYRGSTVSPGAQFSATGTSTPPIPGVQNNPQFNKPSLVGCCFTVSQTYRNKNELAKLRYKFSPFTTASVSYLGSQTYSQQDGNRIQTLPELFAPGPSYFGSLAPGSIVNAEANLFFPPHEFEINNEPIFQAEARTALGANTLLGRWYAASINRLIYNGLNSDVPWTTNFQLFGTAKVGGVPTTFNGVGLTPVTVAGAYFRQTEEDKLHGGSLEFDHPVGDALYTIAYDQSNSTTISYSLFGTPAGTGPTASVAVPGGASQRFTTVLVRGIVPVGKTLTATVSNYFNHYHNRYSSDGGMTFFTSDKSHYDARLGLAYRPASNVAWRFSAGSAIAPPYAALLNQTFSAPRFSNSDQVVNETLPSANIRPETAFGYDLGGDIRLSGDPNTVFSFDGYRTTLRDQFVTGVTQQGNVSVPLPLVGPPVPCSPPAPNSCVPFYVKQTTNLGRARYEGLELSVKRAPPLGFGYTASLEFVKAYPFNVDPSFYAPNAAGVPTTNLAIVPGINFETNATGGGVNAISNHSIPYSKGYFELNVRAPRQAYYSFGATYYGNNNSFNRPAFVAANATMRLGLDERSTIQLSVDNLFNTYPNSTIEQQGGTTEILANGKIALLNGNNFGPRTIRLLYHRQVTQ